MRVVRREGMWAGWREAVGRRRKQRAGRSRPNYGGCWQGTRGAHQKHVLHICDAGRVPAQRLVERPRVLPSSKGSIGRAGSTCGPGMGGRGAVAARAVRREDPTAVVAGRGTRGEHVKYAVHGYDAGCVEAQRLVERKRALPSRKGSMGRGTVCRPGDGKTWGGGGASSAQGGPHSFCGDLLRGRARSARKTCTPWL